MRRDTVKSLALHIRSWKLDLHSPRLRPQQNRSTLRAYIHRDSVTFLTLQIGTWSWISKAYRCQGIDLQYMLHNTGSLPCLAMSYVPDSKKVLYIQRDSVTLPTLYFGTWKLKSPRLRVGDNAYILGPSPCPTYRTPSRPTFGSCLLPPDLAKGQLLLSHCCSFQ